MELYNYIKYDKNLIKGILDIKLNEINNKIVLFNTEIKSGIDVYLNNNKINMIQDGTIWKINYNFNKYSKLFLMAILMICKDFLKNVLILNI